MSIPDKLVTDMKIQVITLFPEMFDGVFKTSMLWKAEKEGAAEYSCVNLRDFGLGPRKQVDDTPYGGGDGMVLMIEPLLKAVEFAKKKSREQKVEGKRDVQEPLVLLMTPRGKLYKQSDAKRLASLNRDLIIICGRYEGYDERITKVVDESICIGNYILTGGEIPAMIVTDSIVRLLPGVLGGETSAEIESFYGDDETIEAPQYTRPAEFEGMSVPDVLLSGNHGEIEKWRQQKFSN